MLWCVASGLLCSFVCLGWVRCLEFSGGQPLILLCVSRDLPNVRHMLGSSSASADTWRHTSLPFSGIFSLELNKRVTGCLWKFTITEQLEIVSLQGAFKVWDLSVSIQIVIYILIFWFKFGISWNAGWKHQDVNQFFKMHIKIMPCLLEVDTFFIC